MSHAGSRCRPIMEMGQQVVRCAATFLHTGDKVHQGLYPAGAKPRHLTNSQPVHHIPSVERQQPSARRTHRGAHTPQVVTQLQQQFKIEPCFTQLVWQKLEEQNQEFFKAYYTRLKLKDQIVLFNHLLDEQVKMFGRMPHGGHLMPGESPYPNPSSLPFTRSPTRPWKAER